MHHSGRRPEEGESQEGEEVRTHVTTQSSHAAVASMASGGPEHRGASRSPQLSRGGTGHIAAGDSHASRRHFRGMRRPQLSNASSPWSKFNESSGIDEQFRGAHPSRGAAMRAFIKVTAWS